MSRHLEQNWTVSEPPSLIISHMMTKILLYDMSNLPEDLNAGVEVDLGMVDCWWFTDAVSMLHGFPWDIAEICGGHSVNHLTK